MPLATVDISIHVHITYIHTHIIFKINAFLIKKFEIEFINLIVGFEYFKKYAYFYFKT